MDFTPIIAQIWGTLGWFIPPILLIGLLKSSWAKGHIGELLVPLLAHWQLEKQTYRRLQNLTPSAPDGTMQKGRVFLSYGIFALEAKSISGWVFGGGKQTQWTQKHYKRRFKLNAPLRQDYKHLNALEATLGINPKHLRLVITFVGRSTFKTEMPTNVIQGIGFVRYIKLFQQMVFREAEVDADALLHALKADRCTPPLATYREHVQNLKRRNDPTAERQCPKVRQRSGDPHREIWPEGGAAILRLFGVSQVQRADGYRPLGL